MNNHEALKIALISRVKTSAPYEPDYMMPPPQIQVAAKEAIDELEQQLAALNAHQIAYEAQAERELAEREKQIVMLREHAKAIRGHMNLYRLFSCEGSDSYDPEYAEKNLDKVSEHAEALAATADLSGCILCDAKPSAFSYRPYISAEYEHESSGWSNSLFYNDHAPKNAKDVNPLYKAKEQK